jgi:rhodanese-related sulfurtransferase
LVLPVAEILPTFSAGNFIHSFSIQPPSGNFLFERDWNLRNFSIYNFYHFLEVFITIMSFLFAKPDNHYEFSRPDKPQDRVKLMEPASFQRIINDDLGRPKHQIIDIREKEEYDISHLEGDDIIRLPLSEKENWIDDIRKGKKLDPNKITIVVDHYGVRSYNFAIFLGKTYLPLAYRLLLYLSFYCISC